MKKQMLVILGLIGLSVGLSSCAAVVAGGATGAAAATDPRGVSGVVDDQSIEHYVNNALSAHAPDGSYTVASFQGRVLLAGQVPSKEYKSKAYTAAKNTQGVKHVYNYLKVAANESVSDISYDAYLTSLAKTRLFGQKGVNSNNVKVVTCNSVVYILGKDAGDPLQIKGAIDGIKNIDGVDSVVNLISK